MEVAPRNSKDENMWRATAPAVWAVATMKAFRHGTIKELRYSHCSIKWSRNQFASCTCAICLELARGLELAGGLELERGLERRGLVRMSPDCWESVSQWHRLPSLELGQGKYFEPTPASFAHWSYLPSERQSSGLALLSGRPTGSASE